MRQRLKSVLALLDNDSTEQLIHRFLTINHHRQRFSALMVSMFNASEGRLDCYHQPDGGMNVALKLDANIEDVNHPLVRVLRNGFPEVWGNLYQGYASKMMIFAASFRRYPRGVGCTPYRCLTFMDMPAA